MSLTPEVTTVLVAIVGAVSAVVGGLIGAVLNRPKTGAEAQATLGGAWDQIFDRQQGEIDALRKELGELRGARHECEEELHALRRRVAQLEVKTSPRPPRIPGRPTVQPDGGAA